MLYLAVRYDVQALVKEDRVARACPVVYYLLSLLVRFGVWLLPLCSVDGVVSSTTVDAVHSTLREAAVDSVVPATAIYVVVARVCVVWLVGTAPEGAVGP